MAVETANSRFSKAFSLKGKRQDSSSAATADAGTAEQKANVGENQQAMALPPPAEEEAGDTAAGASPQPTGTVSRLERRIHVLERALADMAERHEKTLRDRSGIQAAIEEAVSEIRARLENAAREHAQHLADLRSEVSQNVLRLTTLENQVLQLPPAAELPLLQPPSAQLPLGYDESGDLPPGHGGFAAPVPVREQLPVRTAAESSRESASGNHSYLAAARQAAMAAHTDNLEKQSKSRDSRKTGAFSRSRVALLAAAAPAVIVGVAIFALNRHTVTARPEPKPVRVASLPAATKPVQRQPAASAKTIPVQPPSAPPQVQVGASDNPTPAQTASAGPIDQLTSRAKAGDVAAQRDLGLKYLAGDGVAVDEAAAAGWLMRSAYAGEANAEYWLGTLYSRGHGVPADATQANHWYQAAAQQGNRRAMHSLAVANFEGWGLTKNSEEAARWFAKSAELGLVDSQFDLAVLYERGAGVAPSKTEAYKWYAIAAKSGDREAEGRMAVLAKELNPAELAQAQKAAAAFQATPMNESANANIGKKSGG